MVCLCWHQIHTFSVHLYWGVLAIQCEYVSCMWLRRHRMLGWVAPISGWSVYLYTSLPHHQLYIMLMYSPSLSRSPSQSRPTHSLSLSPSLPLPLSPSLPPFLSLSLSLSLSPLPISLFPFFSLSPILSPTLSRSFLSPLFLLSPSLFLYLKFSQTKYWLRLYSSQ